MYYVLIKHDIVYSKHYEEEADARKEFAKPCPPGVTRELYKGKTLLDRKSTRDLSN